MGFIHNRERPQFLPDESQEQPTRAELLEARDRLTEQFNTLENPMRSWDRNPELIAKIQGMIDELNECLVGLEPRDAPKP